MVADRVSVLSSDRPSRVFGTSLGSLRRVGQVKCNLAKRNAATIWVNVARDWVENLIFDERDESLQKALQRPSRSAVGNDNFCIPYSLASTFLEL